MTLMGAKRDPKKPRKPLKRSGWPLKRRTGIKTTRTDEEYEEFMRQFRGLPSLMSGRTHSPILRDENGVPLKTEAHHILPRSVYPEYALCCWNIAVLTREEHSWAEDNPTAFMHWLHDEHPVAWKYVKEHNHHRRD